MTTTAAGSGQVTLGDRTVHRVGFGGMKLSGPRFLGPPADREAALAVLRRAVELGVTHVDTSGLYGPHVVNDLIRDRKSTRLNSSHANISYAVFCLKKKKYL